MNSVFLVPRDQFAEFGFLKLRRSAATVASIRGHVVLHCAMARSAIYLALRALRLPSSSTVLIPAYICRSVVEAVQAHGAAVEYYEIRPDCTPDIGDLADRLKRGAGAVLVAHYFGFPQVLGEIQELCSRAGAFLIEDCAHVLPGTEAASAIGSNGDASVFSLSKYFPLADGGLLRIHSASARELTDFSRTNPYRELRAFFSPVEQSLLSRKGRLSRLFAEALGLISRGGRLVGMLPSAPVDPAAAASSFKAEEAALSMTRASRLIFSHSDIPAIAARRRFNYMTLVSRIVGMTSFRPLHPRLPDGVCPWVLPVFFDHRPDGHLDLRRLGIPAMTWGGVRPEDSRLDAMRSSQYLYDHLVFLPVHQSLDESDLDAITDLLVRVA